MPLLIRFSEFPSENVSAILHWLDTGGEESQGAHHARYPQQQLQQQQQQQRELPQAYQQPLQHQQDAAGQQEHQQYYSPVERSRSLLLLLGPQAPASLLQLAAAAFGEAALAPSFSRQPAADLFNAVSVDLKQQKQQQQQQQKQQQQQRGELTDGTLFVVRDVLEGHPHVVTQLAEGEEQPLLLLLLQRKQQLPQRQPHAAARPDEVLLYRGGYHLGALQIGCGIRGCSKEPLPTQAFPLLLAPNSSGNSTSSSNSSSSINSSSNSGISSTSRMAFASALQTRNNSRVLLLSGPAACSSEFTSLTSVAFGGYELRVANRRFCEEAAAWALNRRGVLRWSNVKHHKVGAAANSRLYTLGSDVQFSVDIHELQNGKPRPRRWWSPFKRQDVQVEYVMADPFVRVFLQRKEADSPTFSTQFKAPDRHGIFKFVLQYARVGYSSLFFYSLAPLRTVRSDETERLQPSAAFYYFVAILVLLATVAFTLLFTYGSDSVSPSAAKAKKSD
ncbi:hypothetical protein Efla_007773 [Eimeria flavescens]